MPTSRDQKCALLRKNLCFENFFETLCVDRDQTAAIWLENDREQSYNYEEFHARALQTAARIDDARLGRRDGWVGLCLETCVDWPILFWGLLAAGRKPLLLESVLWQSPTTMQFPALHEASRLPKHFRSCKFSQALKSVQKKIRSCIFWDTALMAKTQTCKPISPVTARSGRADENGCWHFWRKKVFPLPSEKSLLPTTAAPQADRILQKPCF